MANNVQGIVTATVDQLNRPVEVAQEKVAEIKGKIPSIDKVKSTVKGEVTNVVKGAMPNISNPFSAKPNDERPKNTNARSTDDLSVKNDWNLNDIVLPYENILLKYHNVTWNFSLYSMEPEEYALFWSSPNQQITKYIIAQSGVTGRYSITNVKIKSVAPATPASTSNFSFNECTIEISEDSGMSLWDEIVVMSNRLGYQKFMDVPMVLELNFVGYDQNTGKPETITGLNRKWCVRINDIKGRATESGGTVKYDMNLVANRTALVDNKDWTMLEPYTCTSATFGDFLQSIQDKLNEQAEEQYGYLTFKYPEFANNEFFTIHVPSELATMTINYDAKQSTEVGNTKNGQQGAKNFSWAANVPFSRAIDDVLDCCVPLHESTDRKRQFVNIIPVRRYVGFDNIRNTSVYKNDFYIVKYKIGDVTSEDDLKQDKFNIEYFFENADKFADPNDNTPKLNIKRYDYQFTGLNQEILNLDIKFDQGFNLAVTRNPTTQIDFDNRLGTHNAEILVLDDVRYDTSVTTNVTAMWSKKVQLEKDEREGRALSDEEQQFIRDATAAASDKLGLSIEGVKEQLETRLDVHARVNEYIEDYRDEYDLTYAGTEGIGSDNGQVKSIPLEPTNIVTATSGSVNDNSTEYEMDRRLMRDNYYNRAFLGKLDMKVIGDPYWLGWSDYSYLQYLDRVVNDQEMAVGDDDIHFANYIDSEAYLLLNIKPVVAISNNTGILEIDTPTIFTQTIYRVNSVVSEFDGSGKFTQQLTGGLVIRSLRRRDQTTDYDEGTASNGDQ
ncbi:hypothetical protein EJP02_237 [Escherichia phage EJP2]|nr:hypothetical protein EJP02_237 [Escherichia phage EJP2]